MGNRSGIVARGASTWWLVLVLLGLAAPVVAQEAVLTQCTGKVGAKAARKIRRQISRAIKAQGVDLVKPAVYLRAARTAKVARRAWEPQSVAKVAPRLELEGVVTCTIQRRKGRYTFVFKVIGADGSTRDEVRLRNRKPVLGRPGIEKVAVVVRAALGGATAPPEPPDDIALVPLVPLAPVDGPGKEEEPAIAEAEPKPDAAPGQTPGAEVALVAPKDPADATADEPADGPTDRPEDAPVDAPGQEKQPAGADRPPPADLAFAKAVGQQPAPATEPEPVGEVARQAPERPGEPKSVPEVWVAAGASMHLRAGLDPRYQAGPFPGFRVEGRAFLGAFLDMTGVSDLGLEFAYDRGIGLTYGSAFRQDQIDAYEQHWRAGLVYRLSFEQVTAGPAILFRVGYGNTTNGVDKAYPDLVSAGYSHLDVTVDAHVWLVRPLLKAYLSAGWVALVQPSESLSGSGMGVTFSGGVALEVLDAVHLSAGYEQWQFVFDEDAMGETSDRFQMLFVRAGWTYR